MVGRKPKPAEQHRRNGDPGKRGRGKTVPGVGKGVPVKPAGMEPAVSKAWGEITGLLAEAGILDGADGLLVEQAATSLALYRRARKAVFAPPSKGGGLIVPGQKNAAVAHPLLATVKSFGGELRALFEQLGIGPIARARLGIAGADGSNPDRDAADLVGDSPRRLRAVQGGTA